MEHLKEQKIESQSSEAIAYRNIHRTKVDKLFNKKYNATGNRKNIFDRKARQLWRRIIKHSNIL